MQNDIEKAEFFNQLSLSTFEDMAGKSSEDIFSRLKSLEVRFENDIKELIGLSGGNKSRTKLLRSASVELILKGLVNESSLSTQTKYVDYLMSKLMLCQKTVILLVNILINKHNRFKFLWKKPEEKDNSNPKDERYLFHTIYELYGQIYGLCQNIGTAIRDYFDIYQKIKSGISKREKDFKALHVQHSEFQVTERTDEIIRETENCLLVNPSESILGLSAVSVGLECLIIIKIGDKIKQHIGIKSQSNNVNVRFTSKFKIEDVSHIINELFPDQKKHEVLDRICMMSNNIIHQAISSPNYISWGCFSLVREELEKMVEKLNPDDVKLGNIIARLKDKEKLCFT